MLICERTGVIEIVERFVLKSLKEFYIGECVLVVCGVFEWK